MLHKSGKEVSLAKTKSWVLTGSRKMEYREFDIPEVGEEDMLIRVKTTLICGTDVHRYVNDDGGTPFPLIMGHEFAGVVHMVGRKAAELYQVKPGDHVTVEPYIPCGHCEFCLSGRYQLCDERRTYGLSPSMNAEVAPYINGAYGEYVFVRYGSRVYKLEEGVSFDAGALSSVIGNGYRMIVTHGEVKPNDSVLIEGPGALGLCTVIAAKEAGAYPIIVTGVGEGDAKRMETARELGADYTIRLDREDGIARIMEITQGRGVDAVMECSGAIPAYRMALDAVKKTGTVVLLGMPGGVDVPMHVDTVIEKEIQIRGSLGQPGNVEYAMKTINKKSFPLDKLVTDHFSMKEADKAMEFFLKKEDPSTIRVAMHND